MLAALNWGEACRRFLGLVLAQGGAVKSRGGGSRASTEYRKALMPDLAFDFMIVHSMDVRWFSHVLLRQKGYADGFGFAGRVRLVRLGSRWMGACWRDRIGEPHARGLGMAGGDGFVMARLGSMSPPEGSPKDRGGTQPHALGEVSMPFNGLHQHCARSRRDTGLLAASGLLT